MKRKINFKKSKYYYLFFAMMFLTNIYGQELKFFKEFNNSNLDYGVYRTSLFQDGSDEISKPDVFIKINLNDDIRDLYMGLTNDQILSALSDVKTDWSINLFLYEFYKKSATKFLVIKKREDWIKTSKSDDLKYWKQILKDR